jgi:hypothetical protein
MATLINENIRGVQYDFRRVDDFLTTVVHVGPKFRCEQTVTTNEARWLWLKLLKSGWVRW